MSYFPTSAELRRGIRWLRRHPYISGGIAAAAIAAAVAYYLSGEGDDNDERKDGGGSGPPERTGDEGAAPKTPSLRSKSSDDFVTSPSLTPVRRSVVWSDDKGGQLESILGEHLSAVPPAAAIAPSPASTSTASLQSRQASAASRSVCRADSSTCVTPNDSIPLAGSQPSSFESQPMEAPSPTGSVIIRKSPIVQSLALAPSASTSPHCDSPLDKLRSQGFRGTNAAGVEAPVSPDDGSGSGQLDIGDWGHFTNGDEPLSMFDSPPKPQQPQEQRQQQQSTRANAAPPKKGGHQRNRHRR